MKKCPYCTEEIQRQAVVWPHCLKTVPPRSRIKTAGACLLLLLVVSLVASRLWDLGKPIGAAGPAVKTAWQTTMAPQEQAGQDTAPGDSREARQALIEQMIADGYLDRIEPGWPTPFVWVTSTFLAGSYSKQESLVKIIYARYAIGGRPQSMTLYSSTTGRVVAVYHPFTGLQFGE